MGRLFVTCLPFKIRFYDPIRASTQPLSIVGITTSLFTAGSIDEQKKFENSEVGVYYNPNIYFVTNNF